MAKDFAILQSALTSNNGTHFGIMQIRRIKALNMLHCLANENQTM